MPASPPPPAAAMAHSPLPWKINPADGTEISADSECMVICRMPAPLYMRSQPANAALIVRCVNSHAALVEALRAARKTINAMGKDLESAAPQSINALTYGDELRRIDAALASAGRRG